MPFSWRPDPAFSNGGDGAGWRRDDDPDQPDLPLIGLSPVSLDASVREWFEISPRPCFLIAADGHIRAQNREARRLLAEGSGVYDCRGKLSFHCEASQRFLVTAIATVCAGRAERVRRLVRSDDAQWRMLWVLANADRTSAFVSLSPNEDDIDVVQHLTDAFGLTRAECGVMRRLLNDETPKQVGAALMISTNTVRGHLRSIYGKMNVRGLAQALRLASKLTAP